MKENVIYTKSFNFAIQIINLYKSLCTNKEYVLSKQLLRSGTSIGANISEAILAQSKKDFIFKMHIALKEANETKYWIDLLITTNYIDSSRGNELLNELTEILKLLNAIIKTSKANISND